MDKFIEIISATSFMNNSLLLAFYLIFGIAFIIESNNPKSPVAWIDMLLDKKTNRVSLSKIGQFIGIATSTWLVIALSSSKEGLAILPAIFPAWLAFIGGAWSYSQWLKSKENKSSNSQE